MPAPGVRVEVTAVVTFDAREQCHEERKSGRWLATKVAPRSDRQWSFRCLRHGWCGVVVHARRQPCRYLGASTGSWSGCVRPRFVALPSWWVRVTNLGARPSNTSRAEVVASHRSIDRHRVHRTRRPSAFRMDVRAYWPSAHPWLNGPRLVPSVLEAEVRPNLAVERTCRFRLSPSQHRWRHAAHLGR